MRLQKISIFYLVAFFDELSRRSDLCVKIVCIDIRGKTNFESNEH